MSFSYLTDWPTLFELAKARGIRDLGNLRIGCGSCTMEVSREGVLHFPDCEEQRIVFLKQVAGEWVEQGSKPTGLRPPDEGPLAFSP